MTTAKPRSGPSWPARTKLGPSGKIPQARRSSLLMLLLLVAIFVLDYFTPLGVAVWLLYLAPLWVSYRSPRRWMPLAVAAIGTVLIAAGFFVSPPGLIFPWLAALNRCLGAIILWMTAALLIRRKRVEESFLKEKEFSDALLDSMPGVFYLFSDKGKFLRWNKNFEAASGYSAAEIAQMSPLDFFHEEEKVLVQKAIQEVFDTRASAVEAGLVAKDGKEAPYYFTGLRMAIDGMPHLIGMGIDITQRTQAEQAARVCASRFRRLVESNVVGVMIADIHGRIKEANDALLDMIGYTRAELQSGQLRLDKITPEEWRAVDEHIRAELLRSGACAPCEKEYFHRDGRRVPVLATVALLEGTEGDFICLIENITKRKRAEEEIQSLSRGLEQRVRERTAALEKLNASLEAEVSERKRAEATLVRAHADLKGVLDASTEVAIIAGDPNLAITVFNSGAEKMLGFTAEEIVGKKTPAVFHLESEVEAYGKQLTEELGRPIRGGTSSSKWSSTGVLRNESGPTCERTAATSP